MCRHLKSYLLCENENAWVILELGEPLLILREWESRRIQEAVL